MPFSPSLPCLGPRDPKTATRAVTPLELLFDLAAVVAIGAASANLSSDFATGGAGPALLAFMCSFFMIWWAWMNYTWFASAYDDGSGTFRVLTFVLMFGSLMMAAGVGDVFAGEPIWLALAGFVVMRMALVVLWLGAARGDPDRRQTALRYAGGITLAQVYWITLVATVSPGASAYLPLFAAGAAVELMVPVVAERKNATGWHRAHIVARYGRLTLIVLGQCFIAIVAALQTGAADGDVGLLWQAVLFALIAFSLWSLYFAEEGHLEKTRLGHALLWGYGHVAVFAGAALVGSGMRVLLLTDGSKGEAGLLIGVAAAVFIGTLWMIRDRLCLDGRNRLLLPLASAVLVVAGVVPGVALELIAATLVVTAVTRRQVSRRRATG